MANMLSFLGSYGQYSLIEKPFTQVDALICSQLSYIVYDKAAGRLPARLNSLLGQVEYGVIERDNRRLFELCACLPRYKNALVYRYVNEFDPSISKQFAAVTLLLEDGTAFASFRGTDSTLVGWKEDFMLTFTTPVPAQERAARYLNEIAQMLSCPLRVGGHSKGGNLAVYAAAFCEPQVRSRITEVYTCDGPGFEKSTLQSEQYRSLLPRVRRFLPESSVVGLLMEQDSDYLVIDSTALGVYQHNPYTWKTEGDHFLTKDKLNFSGEMLGEAQRAWFNSLSPDQLRDFADTLFDVLTASNPRTLRDIHSSVGSLIATLSAITNMPQDDQTRMKAYLKHLLSSLYTGSEITLRRRMDALTDKLQDLARRISGQDGS